MMNKNERMNKLNNAGINTSKYFTVDLDNGTKIHLIIDENGQPVVVDKKADPIANQIIEDGYVRNTKLHRRFVMAQMFKMLNYVSWDGYDKGFHAYLNNMYAYDYTFKMMLDEVKVLSKLEVRDYESFKERSHFFTKEVILEVMSDYIEKLKKHIEAMPSRKCKGVPYKRIKGQNIFVEDLSKKIYAPLFSDIYYVKYAKSYETIYRNLNNFMNRMIALPYNTPKSKAWIDAFKGEGAYYTLKNLVMYHNCAIETDYTILRKGMAMQELKNRLDTYQGEGWRMFALMKKVIKDNNFDFTKRMVELGVK